MAADEPFSKDVINSLWRSERKYKSLQPMRRDFYTAAAQFLKERSARYSGLDKTTILKIDDSSSVIRDIIQYRMKKIAGLAVLNVFGANSSLDLLTEEERRFYDMVKKECQDFSDKFDIQCDIGARTAPESDLTTAAEPEIPVSEPAKDVPPVPPEDEFPIDPEFDMPEEMDPPDEFPMDVEETLPPEEEMPPESARTSDTPTGNEEPGTDSSEERRLIPVRIIQDIPIELTDETGTIYRLKKGMFANLPPIIADGLLANGFARESKQSLSR